MTQQGDTTSQQPGASQSGDGAGVLPAEPASQSAAPYWPSPYLAEGQSAPEAYPAPARPGQPRYGDPAGQLRTGPQRPGRPAFGQRGPSSGPAPSGPGAQAGPPGFAVPVDASAAARPAGLVLASAWERLLAMTMDWLLILVASFLLLHEQMAHLVDRLQAVMTSAQALGPTAEQNAFVTFEQNPATISALVSYFLMVFLIAVVYFWALEARGGATLGKRVLGLRVVNLPEQTPAGIWSAGVRTILFLTGPAVFAFAGAWGLSIISLLGAALWFADSLVLATDPQKRSLHDRLAGTIVVRKAPARPRASR
jgi:uncharacterized RDD family membrane protein YckC